MCATHCVRGGQCYIEDLACRAPFTPRDLDDLHRVVHGVSVTSIEDYAGDLRQAGLSDVVATDLTDDWAPYAARRLAGWRRDRETYSAVPATRRGRRRICSTR